MSPPNGELQRRRYMSLPMLAQCLRGLDVQVGITHLCAHGELVRPWPRRTRLRNALCNREVGHTQASHNGRIITRGAAKAHPRCPRRGFAYEQGTRTQPELERARGAASGAAEVEARAEALGRSRHLRPSPRAARRRRGFSLSSQSHDADDRVRRWPCLMRGR